MKSGKGKSCSKAARSAFSLVELSIVLVILGLLAGGILSGQALIRAAELRSVGSEGARYAVAIQSFRDKYFSLPGDMNNATQFWGRQVADDTNCLPVGGSVSVPGTCNGNGDGIIDFGTAINSSGELWQFWRQLALGGLIEGSYSGLAGPNASAAGHDAVPGSNVPKSKLGNGGWSARYLGTMPGDASYYQGEYGNFFNFGATYPGNTTVGAILKPEEAWNIDTKLDDGMPATGKIMSNWNGCSTSTGNTDTAKPYNLSVNAGYCILMFVRI